MNPKATTLTERMGFKDPDLTTPEHDKIILWLYNKNNILTMIKKIYKSPTILDEDKIYDIKSEYPVVSNYNNFIIGFIDVVIFTSEDNFYVEVKPKITSFGETLRQINTYRKYLGFQNYIIITTKTDFKEYFEKNGILIYELEE